MELEGLPGWFSALEKTKERMERAVERSVRQGAMVEKAAIKANIGGAPRWKDHVNTPRGGGPGILTGKLQRSIGFSRVRKSGFGRYRTTLGARRPYATATEKRYPYFQIGVESSKAEVDRIFWANYRSVVV